jgi:serine/threonine-protein kinase
MMMQSTDGTDEPRLLLDLKRGEAWPSSFSADGKWLAYYVVGSTPAQVAWEIWLLPMENPAAARKLAIGYAARFSPDGRWIAWESSESGRTEIHMQAFPDGGRQIVVSTGGGRSAMWSRDGKRLFYWQGDELMEVDVNASPQLKVGTPALVFNGARFEFSPARRSWAITPVDDGFIILAPVAGSSTQTHLSFDTGWLSEVDRKLQAARN